MDSLYGSAAGFDIHRRSAYVAVRRAAPPAARVVEEVRTFGTRTNDLLRLRDWLGAMGVTHVAMEATGVLWKPLWDLLGGHFTLPLVNPRQLKQVPGRNSDVRDCRWLAQLLRCGLLRGSFVPGRPQRELRDLTRHRAQLRDEHTRVANRVHKVLEDANIKVGAVASDLPGKSGRKRLRALLAGERDPVKLADLAEKKLRQKLPQLRAALVGRFTEHHRFLVGSLPDHLGYLERQLDAFSRRIAECLQPLVSDADVDRLDAVVGVNRCTIENVVAEIGADLGQFASADHLSSWAGVCPGTEKSAGEVQRSRCAPGNRWLKRALTEAAWAASHSKSSYLAAQYHRLAGRRGKKRALLAVAHSLLVIFYHLLKRPVEYRDLGRDYFDRLQPERLRRYLVKRLESLGYDVTLCPRAVG
jgi:transposase